MYVCMVAFLCTHRDLVAWQSLPHRYLTLWSVDAYGVCMTKRILVEGMTSAMPESEAAEFAAVPAMPKPMCLHGEFWDCCGVCMFGSPDNAPAPGTWADVARMMAAGDDSGFDWDAWKDQMKDGE